MGKLKTLRQKELEVNIKQKINNFFCYNPNAFFTICIVFLINLLIEFSMRIQLGLNYSFLNVFCGFSLNEILFIFDQKSFLLLLGIYSYFYVIMYSFKAIDSICLVFLQNDFLFCLCLVFPPLGAKLLLARLLYKLFLFR